MFNSKKVKNIRNRGKLVLLQSPENQNSNSILKKTDILNFLVIPVCAFQYMCHSLDWKEKNIYYDKNPVN